MTKIFDFFERVAKLLFLLSVLLLAFWVIFGSIDVYQYAVVGAVYEILWFPFLLLFFTLPIINLVMYVKNKFSFKTIWLYALLINGLTVFYLYKSVGY
ncbi:hypothetical protein Q764_10530 [Flavobacterium suncheonense GH29-5 = DSM 17707]|uniref:Uncharacterized protein n=1 Tax=Flavobacterium suncheonense GH29-5 = DSM 17707 TaxID=1121899 RepID=A0A0A2M8M2_9FLAO|nr:hypothetical protein Q764_10530 [Flavobacterium suncheonense GH29-5 = DSM 17707]